MKCLQKISDENTWKMKSRWGLNVSANSFKKVRNLKKVQVKIVDIFVYYFKFHILIYSSSDQIAQYRNLSSNLKKWF